MLMIERRTIVYDILIRNKILLMYNKCVDCILNCYCYSDNDCIDCLVIHRDLVFLQAWNFLCRLPILNVSLSIKGCWDDSVQPQNEVPVPSLTTDMRDDKRWIRLHADQEYVLQINLQRTQMGYQVDSFIISFPRAQVSNNLFTLSITLRTA